LAVWSAAKKEGMKGEADTRRSPLQQKQNKAREGVAVWRFGAYQQKQ
jgi:hypothetical protein